MGEVRHRLHGLAMPKHEREWLPQIESTYGQLAHLRSPYHSEAARSRRCSCLAFLAPLSTANCSTPSLEDNFAEDVGQGSEACTPTPIGMYADLNSRHSDQTTHLGAYQQGCGR
jgi:hypothetical protein